MRRQQKRVALSKVFILPVIVFLFCLAAGCHHPEHAVPDEHPEPWTPSEVENMLGGTDPLEGFNRAMFSVTDFLMCYVADPLGRVYTTIFPRFFIEHFNNVCVNLEYPARAISCLLQAEWGAAGNETIRFLANSTLGIAGIFDVAGYWWHIPSSRAEFGQTFYRWGIGPGETLVLPVAPAVNGRDMIGLIFDAAFDIKTYIPYAGYATALNRMVIMQQSYDSVAGNALDPYKSYRQALLIQRELQKELWFYHEIKRQIAEHVKKSSLPEVPEVSTPAPDKPQELSGRWLGLKDYHPQDNIRDSLRLLHFKPQKDNDPWYMRLSLFNSDFVNLADIRKIELHPDRPAARYAYWETPELPQNLPPQPEKLVLLLPGIGGSCNAGALAALAEYFHNSNCKVVGVDSTFNWRFIVSDSECRLPGFLPEDAYRIRRLLLAVLDDLRRRKQISKPEIILAGYSMGGLHTLKIADIEAAESLLGISRYVAVNPPVSLGHAMTQVDQLAASSANWSKSEIKRTLIAVAGTQLLNSGSKYPPLDPAKPERSPLSYRQNIPPAAAKVLTGLYLKLSLRELLLAAHRERKFEILPEYSWWRCNQL